MAQSADSLNNAFLGIWQWKVTVDGLGWQKKCSRIRFSWSRLVISLRRFNIHKLHQAWIINYLFHGWSAVIIVVWFHFITNLPGLVHATFASTIGQWFKLLHLIVNYCSSQINHALLVSNALARISSHQIDKFNLNYLKRLIANSMNFWITATDSAKGLVDWAAVW